MDGTGTTERRLAPDVEARVSQSLAERLGEQFPGLDGDGMWLPVDRQIDSDLLGAHCYIYNF